jgi:polysaccharide export outer membrane protein
MKKLIWILPVTYLLLSSCGEYKKITYLQATLPEKDTIYKPDFTLYKLQPSDLLYITVLSIDKNVSELFNTNGSSSGSQPSVAGGGNMYFSGYSIDKNGFIHLPVIGDVQVGGITVDKATENIQKLADQYIKDARVELKLVSFKITMLGEIGHPGQITIFNDRATILEAIALGGEITYYGNRKNILIVRSAEGGMRTFRIDLTKKELLRSEKFYVQPNDVIYVEPLKYTAFRIRLTDYTSFLTLLTTLITTYILIYQITK